MRANEFIIEAKVSFKVQKGKNKFATTLNVDSKPVGVYQYDADTGRSIAEVYPEFKGKGLGKLLVLHAIYTAAKLGLAFQEDESRTSEYNNVLDSLSGNGYIVDDDGYWYVTGEGEQYLKQTLKQNVNEESKAVKYNGLILKYAFNDHALLMKAFEQGSPIAYVKFVKEKRELYPQDLWVNDDYRNKGIAKSMYDYLKGEGYIINRSHDQTKAGTGFWDKHRGEDSYVWEDSDNESVQMALENWMEMYSTPQDIQTILSSPESNPYKKPPNIQWLYRAIVPKDRDINSIKSNGQVVAFATDMQGAMNFIQTLDINDDYVIIRKPFNPADFLLDFTSMYEAIAQGAHSERYVKEHEVWMKPTPKYTSVNKNEIVYSTYEKIKNKQ